MYAYGGRFWFDHWSWYFLFFWDWWLRHSWILDWADNIQYTSASLTVFDLWEIDKDFDYIAEFKWLPWCHDHDVQQVFWQILVMLLYVLLCKVWFNVYIQLHARNMWPWWLFCSFWYTSDAGSWMYRYLCFPNLCIVFVLYLSISIALLTAWAFQKRSRPQQ